MNRWLIYGAGGLICAAVVLALLRPRMDQPAPQPAQPTQPLSWSGKIDVVRIDDLRVGGRKILLCGVAFRKPEAMRQMVSDAAGQDLRGRNVECRQVGGGTPCDGRTAASFGGVPVMQCKDGEGNDIASVMAGKGYLCDPGGLTAGAYPACAN